jgi:hypothetical protein
MKVVALMVAGFIALLNVAVTIVLMHAPPAPLRGATDNMVGGVRVEFLLLSGSLHPVATMNSRKDMKQIVCALYFRIIHCPYRSNLG